MAENDAPQDFVNTDDKQEETSEKIQELVFPSLEAENIESKTRTTQNPNITAEEDDNRVPHVYCPSMGDIKPKPTTFTEDLIKDVNIILVTATEVEFRAVMGQANDANSFRQVSHDNVTFYLGFYGLCKVAVILTGQGGRKTREYLYEVQEVIRANYVIAVGICYGMKETKVKPGDVIVAESIFDTDNKRAQDGGTISRPEQYKCGEKLCRVFREGVGFDLKNGSDSDVSIKFGPLICESTLVASQEYKDQILSQIPQALGGEMEGNGIMELAKARKFEGIVIKAVADYGNEDKEPYRKWQKFAATAAASYVLFHLQQRDNNLKLRTKIARTSLEEEIAISIFEQHESSLSQSAMTSPYTVIRICQMLYSKKLISERELDRVESSDTALEDKKENLLAAVKTAIFHRKLHELATVLDQFNETKSVAKNIISDYNLKIVKKAASEAMRMNIVDLKITISATFEDIILACKKENLISSNFKTKLLDSSTNKTTRCSNLITRIHNLVEVQPAHLDTFLCILNEDLLASEVANSVAKSYGYNLPKLYERIRGVGGATSVISSDDNIEEMVPQYDQMSNEDRACDILRTHYSTLSQSLKDPVNIARLLHGENVISEDAVTQVNSADIKVKDRTIVLLRSVRKAIHDNHQHVKVFGRVLQLTAGNERVGQDILNDYNKIFPTTSIFSMTSTSSTTTAQSSTGAEATDVRHHITRNMEGEFSAIRGRFGRTLHNILKTLSKHNVPIDAIRSFCKFAFAKYSPEINDCQTMEDVLTFLANQCTLINISVLEDLIDDCEIDEAKQHIQDYQQAIDDFSQKMRARFPPNQSLLPDGTPHPLRGETITFVVDQDPETILFNDIKDLQAYAFGEYAKHVKVIDSKETNSITITCSFPFELTSMLMAEAMKNLKLLKKNGLLKLTIGYCTIWNIRDEEETDKLTKVIKEEINEETVGDTSDITDQQRAMATNGSENAPPGDSLTMATNGSENAPPGDSLTMATNGSENAPPGDSLTMATNGSENAPPDDSLTMATNGSENAPPDDSLTMATNGSENAPPGDSLTMATNGSENAPPGDSLTMATNGSENAPPDDSLTMATNGSENSPADSLAMYTEAVEENKGGAFVVGDICKMDVENKILTDVTDESDSGTDVNPDEFYEIMTSKDDVLASTVRPILLMSGGLPQSGKTEAIKQLLKKASSDEDEKKGFVSYDVISIGLTAADSFEAKDPNFLHHIGFLAGIKSYFQSESKEVRSLSVHGSSIPLDDDEVLKRHRISLSASWEILIKKDTYLAKKFQSTRNFKRGTALIKIWDVAFDSFSLQFLRCFSGHFYNSYMWLFTDVERDLDKLHLPPSEDNTQQMTRRSRIQYLLNPCKLSSNLNSNERKNTCTILAKVDTDVDDNAMKDQISKLQDECRNAALQLGCSDLIKKEIIPFHEANTKLNKKNLIDELYHTVSKAPQGIPLSHLFLRGSLELESSVFMRREELKRKARLCGIDDDESFDEFCKSFTSFGSIIDVGLVSTSDIIIIKPDEFLTTLDQAFNFKRIKNYQVARDGLLTRDVALSLLGKEYQLFLEVLEAVGLATLIAKDQGFLPQEEGYYMPSLRKHNEDNYFIPERIQMVMSMHYPSVNMEVALTKRLLQDNPTFKLTSNMKRNVTKITFNKGEVEIIYHVHEEVVELMVIPDEEYTRDVIEKVVNICKTISQEIPKQRYGKADFHFAILCQKHVHHIGYNFYRKRHILPIEGSLDCPHCPPDVTERFKLWSSVIKDAKISKEFKLDGSLKCQDVAKLSEAISKYSYDHVMAFIAALELEQKRLDLQFSSDENSTRWQWSIMEAISSWMMKPENKESPKKKMAILLIELHDKLKEDPNITKSFGFKQLARELDLQTLTMDQIKSLEEKDDGETNETASQMK